MIRNILENSIKQAAKDVGIKIDVSNLIKFEHPENLMFGDLSANTAFIIAKQTGQKPLKIAQEIVSKINENKPKETSKVEVAGPGFINFYYPNNYFINEVKNILNKGEKFGSNKNLKGEKTVVEYTDPNPFKKFHIGHLMSNAIGESISKIVEANGAKVIRACYQGDVGLHVAKAVWSIMKETKTTGTGPETAVYNPTDAFILGEAYSKGDLAYRTDELAKKEIIEINKKIYNIDPKKTYPTFSEEGWYQSGREKSLDDFEKIYKVLGTTFDYKFFEGQVEKFGKEIVEKNIGKVFEKSDGAVIFKGENYSLHTRVFINSDGLPTYEAKELGLAKIKYDKTKYDKSIVITGNEINEYFKVLLKAMSLIFPELASKTIHISHGMLRMPDGKMSSRTGKVVSFMALLDDVKIMIFEKMGDREMDEKEKAEIAEKIAVGALKYSILKQVNGKDIIFDFDKSISFEGDSGPYLQYSYARAKSVLRKAKEEGIKSKVDPSQIKSQFDGASITILEKLLYRFPEVVERAGTEYSPHYIATYLIELASSFNNFYAMGKIVDKADIKSPYKVALTEAFSIVLKNGLNLLGIQAPERM